MPYIDDYDPSEYEAPKKPKPGAAPTAPPATAGAGGFDLKRLLTSLAQAQQQQAEVGVGAAVGGVKELGRQVTNVSEMAGNLGLLDVGSLRSISQLQQLISSVGREGAPTPVREGFEPQGGAQEAGALGAKVGVPLLASAASAGAAAPLMAGMGGVGRFAAGTALDAGVSGAAAGAQGESSGEAGLMSLVGSAAGAGIGGALRGAKGITEALTKRNLARKGTSLERVNDALGVQLKHVKDGQMPALAVERQGIDVTQPPEKIDAAITAALDEVDTYKRILARSMPPVKRAEIDTVLDNFGGPIGTLIGKVVKQVEAKKLPPSALDNLEPLQELLTSPGDVSAHTVDGARSSLRHLIDQFAAGDKKKGVRRGLEDARKALSDLTPALKADNRQMADLIAARAALRDKMRKQGIAGVPEPEESAISKILQLVPWIPGHGAVTSAARAAGRALK